MPDDPNDPHDLDDPNEHISPGRLQALSDGVFAIAATLLILEVKAPVAGQPVWSTLRHEWAAFDAYAVTFLVIGIAWIHHHNLFHQVLKVDRGLLFLNLGLLGTISFLPLPTATLGNHLSGHDAVPAAVFYTVSMAVSSVWFTFFWHYLTSRPHLVRPSARGETARRRRQSLVGPIGYLVAAAIAPMSPIGSLVVSAAIVVYFIVGRRSPATRTRLPASD